MNTLDLIVLFGTLLSIVAYGVYKTRGQNNIEGYLLGNNSLGWGTIGLSVMATQASAITFISTPGQGYESGMGFVQNYFGLPIAFIIVSMIGKLSLSPTKGVIESPSDVAVSCACSDN